MRKAFIILGLSVGLAATSALAQDKLDFNVGGLKWRCQHRCDTIVRDQFVKVEQTGERVVFFDAKGNSVTASAKTTVRAPPSGPSLKCQMNPKYCGQEPAPKPSYSRSIEIPDWKCTVSVQQKDGEPNTPPPFKAQWLRFASSGCAMGQSIWTTLSAAQVKALEKKCGEWGVNC